MANDSGLTNDTCIFMEAIPGDGGTQNPHDVWWLSPDINLIGPVSGRDTADAGQINPVQVRFHRKSAASGCHFPGDESITVELWVANPSLVMAPHVAGSATRVGFIGSPPPNEGGTGNQQIDWDVPAAAPPDDPQSPGPKCLVARCYPDSGQPNRSFFVPEDQHVAQHNFCIVTTTTHALTFKVNTLNPSAIVVLPSNREVTVRAVLDLNPIDFVHRTVLKRLQALHGFTQIRTTPLSFGFKFDLTGFQSSQVVDHSHPGVLSPLPPNTNPSFQARIVLQEQPVTQLTFGADLKGAAAGEACIFHLTQTSANGAAEGGLTLVALQL
jgi:hypothetical protein